MKIVKIKHVEYDYESIIEYGMAKFHTESIAITEPLEVEFVYLDQKDIAKSKIAIIDKEINKEMAGSEVRLNDLKQRKQELLAIGVDDEK